MPTSTVAVLSTAFHFTIDKSRNGTVTETGKTPRERSTAFPAASVTRTLKTRESRGRPGRRSMAVVARGVPPFDGSVSAACAADAALVPPVAASTASSAVTPSARARRRAGAFESACAAAAVDASERSDRAGGAAYTSAFKPAVSLKGENPHCVSETDAPGALREMNVAATADTEIDGGGCAATTCAGSDTSPESRGGIHGLIAGARVNAIGAPCAGFTAVLTTAAPQ